VKATLNKLSPACHEFSFMNTTKYKTLKQFESSIYPDYEITKKLRKGWVLLAIQTTRQVSTKGDFEDLLVYTLGHEDEL